VKVDSYVLETDVYFPTVLNLLWDAGRKCVDLIEGLLASGCDLPGWRKLKAWRRWLKACERTASQIVYRGGPNKEARVKAVVRAYLAVGGELSTKVRQSLLGLCDAVGYAARWERLAYFHAILAKHLVLVERRLLVATDQQPLIQEYAVLQGEAGVDQSVPVADRLLGRYGAGNVANLSFDKGFTRAEDRKFGWKLRWDECRWEQCACRC